MRSSIGIRVAAPAERLFSIARDVERWPQLLPHYRRVVIHERAEGRVLAQMVAERRFGRIAIPVTWRAEQWAEPDDPADLRLRFRHVRGVTTGMDVTWHVRPVAGGCDVTIEHDFRRRLPLVGDRLPLLGDRLLPAIVDRVFVRHIAGRTLATFRDLAESAEQADANQET